MTKAAALRKIDAAYVMVEQGCNPWLDLDAKWMHGDHAVLRGVASRDRTRFYKIGSYRAPQAA
jgi:hypothetical protein